MAFQNDLRNIVEKFVEEITELIHLGAREQIVGSLLGNPQLPMPRRKPRRLAAPKTRKPKGLPELSERLKKAYDQIKQSEGPVTVAGMATTNDITQSAARTILSQLGRRKLVTTQVIGDGTQRKVYLPARG